MKNRFCFLLAGGLAVLPCAVRAQTLPVAQDSYVVPGSGINFGTVATINAGGGTGAEALVQFDLTSVPAGSNVNKATLILFANKVGAAGSINIAEATNVPWTEAGVTGLNAPSAGTAIASGVPVSTASTYISVDVTQAVKDWLDGAVTNNGLVISGSGGVSVAFDSKESTTTSHPATLTITGVGNYGYVYNLSLETVLIETDIAFDSNGTLAGLMHTAGSSTITLLNAGVYSVTFSVSGDEPSQFALFQNGVPVAGSTYGSGAGTQQNTGQVIVTAAAGDVFTLRNHTSVAAVTLQTLAGGTQANVNASILFLKIQ